MIALIVVTYVGVSSSTVMVSSISLPFYLFFLSAIGSPHLDCARTYTEESVAEKASKISILLVSSLMLFFNPKFNLSQLCQLRIHSIADIYSR